MTRTLCRPLPGLWAWAMLLLALVAPTAARSQSLSVGPTGRYLIDRHGVPTFFQGDAGWSLFVQPNTADAATYLQSRGGAGFNVVLVNLIEHQFASNAPVNAYGQAPFTGRPFATPNEAYFAHVDSILEIARQDGITLLIAPLYLGYGCGSEGWCAEVQAATTAEMRAWGEYVGTRYANTPNIVWVLGGDTDPTPVAAKALQVVDGIRAHDTVHPWTAHNQPETWAGDAWPGQSWLTVNSFYSYTQQHYEWAQEGRGLLPVRPYFLMESTYENEHGASTQQLRAAAYFTVIWGGCGHIYGNCPVWHFGSSAGWCGTVDWRGALASPGTTSMQWVQRLFTSRHWWTIVPDDAHTVLTSGAGLYGQTDYAVAASTSDSSSLFAYLPTARTVTMTSVSLGTDSVRAWWFRPSNGATTLVGEFAAGARAYTPPSSGDWVLVVDRKRLGFAAPGTPIPTAATTPAPRPGLALTVAPHPVRGSARLSFELPAAAFVSVRLFDVQGRLRAVWLERELAPGRHDVPIETTGLRPGVYACRLEAGSRRAQRRVVVAR